MNYETIAISVAAALVVIAVIYWRAKRDERRAADKRKTLEKVAKPEKDVLAAHERRDEPRVEPALRSSGDIAQEMVESEKAALAEQGSPKEKAAQAAHVAAQADNGAMNLSSLNPSELPPIYEELQKEEKRQEAQAADEARSEQSAEPAESRRYPPVDPAVEWVLEISPKEGQQFTLGGIDALYIQLQRLDLPLQIRCWVQSVKDGLYYDAGAAKGPARHMVTSMVLANRSAQLDDVKASAFFQVLEQSAAQSDVAIRRELEPEQAVRRSEALKRFIDYYDAKIEVLIEPNAVEAPAPVEAPKADASCQAEQDGTSEAAVQDASGAPSENAGEKSQEKSDDKAPAFSLDAVERAACAAGFTHASGCWELRAEADDRDPIMSLAFGPEGTKHLVLSLDIPLSSLERVDLQKFFSAANVLACALDARWVDCSHHPIDAGGALVIEESVGRQVELMAQNGVMAGSRRAKLLFARSA